ncbi:ABC transporter ATP-binding protein/permease [Streptomyces sp. NBC_01142]|uniref:ABC transporter ATP-binding protein n=1 Tax=Streptomyces sp. NBC_01142 TaxID=2975865 RepID=UPI00225553C1|nr:ABC transporter ATP-binding protein [Streptomyces sp. NBC_01142]MCX4822351.1 ABC transporter ATP-binding protein/permease [Streptomyces sp. NBC_01142]
MTAPQSAPGDGPDGHGPDSVGHEKYGPDSVGHEKYGPDGVGPEKYGPDKGRPRLRLRHIGTAWLLCWRAGPLLAGVYLVITVVSGLVPTGTAWFTKFIVDDLAAGQPDGVLRWAFGLAALGLAAGVLPHLGNFLQNELARRLDRLMQDRLYTTINGFQGLSRFENPDFRNDLSMAMQASGGAMGPVTTGLFDTARNVITLVSLLGTLSVLSPVMAGLVTVAALPALFARLSLSRRRVSMMAGISPATRRQIFYSVLITDVRGAKETRLFGLGDFLRQRMLGELATQQTGERRLDVQETRTQSLLALLSTVVAGAGLVWAVRAAAAGELSVGDVTAFVAAVAGTQGALTSLVDNVALAHQALLVFGYHDKVVSLPDDLPSVSVSVSASTAAAASAAISGAASVSGAAATPAELPALRGAIELRDVWFRYDESHPWVLRGLNLTIPHGSSVALVGLNGAGKSTLIKLLCRFYDPTRGAILWDGVDIRDVPPAELRRRMGVLFQDYMCYDLTAAENIGVGELDALSDRPRLRKAARMADIDTTVEDLPRGYDTLLSRIFTDQTDDDDPQTGVVLSGGQWQRLALARTLLRDKRDLLILDEPSAGLDAQAEHEIHRRLREHRTGRTSLLVSHRLGAVREADVIVVLDGGRIVERGAHGELLASGGEYARLFAIQAEGYRTTSDAPHDAHEEACPGIEQAVERAVEQVTDRAVDRGIGQGVEQGVERRETEPQDAEPVSSPAG